MPITWRVISARPRPRVVGRQIHRLQLVGRRAFLGSDALTPPRARRLYVAAPVEIEGNNSNAVYRMLVSSS